MSVENTQAPEVEKYTIRGLDVEEAVAQFLSENYVQYPPIMLRRINANGRRLYFYTDENGEPQFFISVTSFIKASMPTSPYLIKWIAERGYEEAKAYSEERAHYGTFLHIQTGQLIVDGKYDLDQLSARLEGYVKANGLSPLFMNYAEQLKKDVAAFAQFCVDYKYEPIAVEMVLCHPDDGYGGAIDHIGTIEIQEKGFFGEVYKSGPRKGEPKESKQGRRVVAIIDVKSGSRGGQFFEENEVQLEAYKQMWDAWFPDLPIEKLYNWSPKDWRGRTPTYNLKDQTGSISREKLLHLVSLAKIDERKYDRKVTLLTGVIELRNGQDGLDVNIQEFGLAEVIKEDEERRAREREDAEVKALEPLFPEDATELPETDENSMNAGLKPADLPEPTQPKKRGRKPKKKEK